MRTLFISFSVFLFCLQGLTLDVGPTVQLSYRENDDSISDDIMQYIFHNPTSIEMFVLDKRNLDLETDTMGMQTELSAHCVPRKKEIDIIPFLRFKELLDALTEQNVETYIGSMKEFFEPMDCDINENESSVDAKEESDDIEESEKELTDNKYIQNTISESPMNFSSYNCFDESNTIDNFNKIKKVCISIKPENAKRFLYVKYPTTTIETSTKVFDLFNNSPDGISIQDIQNLKTDGFAEEDSKYINSYMNTVTGLTDKMNETAEHNVECIMKDHILQDLLDIYFIERSKNNQEKQHRAIRKHNPHIIDSKDKMNTSAEILLNKNMKGHDNKKINIRILHNPSFNNECRNISFLSKGKVVQDVEEGDNEIEEDDDEIEEDDDEIKEDDDDDENEDDEANIEDEDVEDFENDKEDESLQDMVDELIDASTGTGELPVKQVKKLKTITDKVKQNNTIEEIKRLTHENNEETENKLKEYQKYQKETIKKIHESKENIYNMINEDLDTLLKPAQKEYLKVAKSLKQKLLKQYDEMLNEIQEDD